MSAQDILFKYSPRSVSNGQTDKRISVGNDITNEAVINVIQRPPETTVKQLKNRMARLEVFELRHRIEIDERVDEILVTGQNKSMLGGGRREERGGNEVRRRGTLL